MSEVTMPTVDPSQPWCWPGTGVVTAVCCDPTHSFSKPVVDEIRLLAGLGVVGDHGNCSLRRNDSKRRFDSRRLATAASPQTRSCLKDGRFPSVAVLRSRRSPQVSHSLPP